VAESEAARNVFCCVSCRLLQPESAACVSCGATSPLDPFEARGAFTRIERRRPSIWKWPGFPPKFYIYTILPVCVTLALIFTSPRGGLAESLIPWVGVNAFALVLILVTRWALEITDSGKISNRLFTAVQVPTLRHGASRRGIARRIEQEIRTHAGDATALVASLTLRDGSGVLVRSVRACEFMLVVDGGEELRVMGAVEVEGGEPVEVLAVDALDLIRWCRAWLRVESSSEAIVRDGSHVEVFGEPLNELVGGAFRDEMRPVLRGVPGRPVVVRLEA
jgi:hypothetical protein